LEEAGADVSPGSPRARPGKAQDRGVKAETLKTETLRLQEATGVMSNCWSSSPRIRRGAHAPSRVGFSAFAEIMRLWG
jgi:hypothetical protein